MNPYLKLGLVALVPVAISIVLDLLDRKTALSKLDNRIKQIITGVLFGGVAVLATECGANVNGVTLNARDAAPLCAGLLFGAPAGIIAGIIGGLERWIATFWGAGEYTRLACSLATVLAGLFGAGCRKFMFNNKRPAWYYGLAIGITTEVFHMLLIFLTNMSDVAVAFSYVKTAALPMVCANGLAVMLATLATSNPAKDRLPNPYGKKHISQSFQLALLIVVVAAFCVTTLFTFSLQSRLSYANADKLLALNVEDVKNDINDASDRNLLNITHSIADDLNDSADSGRLSELSVEYDVSEINLIDSNGIIIASTEPQFIGYNMADGEQSSEFLVLLSDESEYAQSYQPIAYDESIRRKYAGVALSGGGFIQVGYNAERFHTDIAEQVKDAAKNRHIGQNGCIIICDEKFNLISVGNESYEGVVLETGSNSYTPNERFTATVYGEESFCMYTVTEGYYIVATIPVSEATLSEDIAVYVSVFMELLIFAALFVNVYFLIKKLIVNNIHKINRSLAQITSGNLDVTVDVRANEEFASLSDDINSTVSTLKRYIAEAAARIDKELELARAIQRSALPDVFPPYPDRTDFDVYACMDAAKEVGGDFYDFYLLGKDKLAILIADVSDKGIPAAMFMMTAKTLIKGYAESGLPVNEVFIKANAKLCEGNDAEMFVTGWMGIVDLTTGVLTYANAGHNPPLIYKNNGQFSYLKSKVNFVLAAMQGTRYTMQEIKLDVGDRILLYTDGVTEATDADGQLFGEDRLLSTVNSLLSTDAKELCVNVKATVDTFVGEADQVDDITMLSLTLKRITSAERIATIPDGDSLSVITDFIDNQIERLNIPESVSGKIHIAVDEIYANVCSYSGATAVETVCRKEGDSVVLTISDNGKEYNPMTAKEPDVTLSAEERQIGGLGVFIVKKITSDMSYKRSNGLNILTLEFKLP